jgi:hypothetical protein
VADRATGTPYDVVGIGHKHAVRRRLRAGRSAGRIVADRGTDTPYDVVGIGHKHAGSAPSPSRAVSRAEGA